MKMSCEIIQDLIPLLEDDVCSAQTKAAVTEHIRDCETCRNIYEKSKFNMDFRISVDEEKEVKSMKKGFRKIKRRWFFSILFLLLSIPLLYLCWGEYKGQGYAFSNLHEIAISHRFMKELQKGNYEGAFAYWDIEEKKQDWLENWFDENKLKNIRADAERMFCASASMLKECGGITDYRFLSVSEQAQSYTVYYLITVDKREQELSINVSDEGIQYFIASGSFLTDPVAHLGHWAEYLWEEYEGCTFDPETGEYVY